VLDRQDVNTYFTLVIRSIRSKPLRLFWTQNDAKGLRPDWVERIRLILSRLDAATDPREMNVPGFNFHALKGSKADRFAVLVSRNWRVTFAWDGEDAIDVDLEDYHGHQTKPPS